MKHLRLIAAALGGFLVAHCGVTAPAFADGVCMKQPAPDDTQPEDLSDLFNPDTRTIA